MVSKFTRFLALTEEGLPECVTAVIVNVKFCCKVIRHLMSNSMPILEGFWGDFSVGLEIY